MSIKQKLLLTLFLLLAIFGFFGITNFFAANRTEEALDNVVATFDGAVLPSIDALDEIGHLRHALDEVRLKAHEFLLDEPGAKEEFLVSLQQLKEAGDKVFLNEIIMSYVDPVLVTTIEVTQLRFDKDIEHFITLTNEGKHEEAVAVINNDMEPVLHIIDTQLTIFELSVDQHVEKSGNSFNQLITDIVARMHLVEKVMIGLFSMGFIAVLFLGQRVGNDLVRPIFTLTDAAASIEKGDYQFETLTPIANRPDELGQLARIFQKMGEEVYKREDALKKEVVQLRIQIDQSKRAEDVEKITTTDEFQDLQAKARAARAARRNREEKQNK